MSWSSLDHNGHLFMADASQFDELRSAMATRLLETEPQNFGTWQSKSIEGSRAHDTYELLNAQVWYQMPQTQVDAQEFIKPDLPWAEAHFQERIGGEAINPGVEWKNWPYHANASDLHLKGGQFEHNYMERMWPTKLTYDNSWTAHAGLKFEGYRFDVGDLDDVIVQLQENIHTRQAYLPIWFPEDTGATSGQRVPCTLGYHFIVRDNKLHVQYNMRSCEVYRHFTNDVYMAVRLAQWVAMSLVAGLGSVDLGQLTMNIVSFHGFRADTEKIGEFIK